MAFTEYITNGFLNILDQSVSGGGPITITGVQVGSGYPTGGDNPQNFTGLKNSVQMLKAITSPSNLSGITSINDLVLYQSTVRFQVSSADAPKTYQLNEYGVWASVGAQAPVLIQYASTLGPTGDTITPTGAGVPVIRQKASIVGYSQQATTTTSLSLTNTVDLHAGTHLDNGVDPLPVATTTRTGSLPRISGNPLDTLHGDLSWSSPFATGFLQMTLATTAPNGWLLCQGQAVNRVTYSALFGIIGTSYGAGDGSTTFNLPDLRSRMPLGAGQGTGLTNRPLNSRGGEETHVLSIAELAVHNHGISDPGHTHGIAQSVHSHGLSDPGHAHTISDPGHAHGVYDPTHTHQYIYGNLSPTQGLTSSGPPPWYNNFQGTTIAAATGIGIYGSGTGIGIHTATTGLGVTAVNANIAPSTNLAGTGVSTVNQGSSAGHNTMPPYVAINFLVKT